MGPGRNAELRQCNRMVKELCNVAAAGVSHHGKCNGNKNNAILFSGGDINTYLKSLGTGYGEDSRVGISIKPTAVDKDKMYYICANFQEKIKTAVETRKRKSVDDATEDVRVEEEKRKTRTGCRTKYPDEILKIRYNKKSYDMCIRRQQARMHLVCQHILASCVDRNELKDKGMGYLENNMALSADVVTCLDMITLILSSKLKVNLLTIDNTECYNIVREGDGVDNNAGELGTEISAGHKLARDIYREVTGQAYDRISKEINKITNVDASKLPSVHILTKGRPGIDEGTFLGNADTGSSTFTPAATITTSTTSTGTVVTDVTNPTSSSTSSTSTHTTTTTTSSMGGTTTTTGGTTSSPSVPPTNCLKLIDDVLLSLTTTKDKQDLKKVAQIVSKEKGYMMAKIEQGFEQYLVRMIKTFLLRGWEVKGNMLVIDSYDGAVHSSTNTRDSGIVSYSTLLFHPNYFSTGVSSASSSCILTWMNSLTGESRETLFPILIPIYKQQQILRSNVSIRDGCQFFYYQMHVAKFSYTLTSHAGWGASKSPFLLCDCNKGEAVGNKEHVCHMITDTEQLEFYEKSAAEWATTSTNTIDKKQQIKEKEKHRKWVSRHNKGISHCGIHPSLLPLSIIRCDVFHMGCSIGRRLIDYLRMFSRETGYDFECKLANILNKVWSENVMCLWRLNKKTSKLLGTEIKAFVLKCPDIVKLMRTKEGGFVQTQESIALARGLELWHHIEAHLKRAEVEKKDVDGFPNVLKQFEKI